MTEYILVLTLLLANGDSQQADTETAYTSLNACLEAFTGDYDLPVGSTVIMLECVPLHRFSIRSIT